MKETKRIQKLYADLYNGSPWLGVSIHPILSSLSGKQAARRIYKDWNTIWEIAVHMICWRENVLERLQGKVIRTPAHNYIIGVTDTSEKAWQQTLDHFQKSQTAWDECLAEIKSAEFEIRYPGNGMTYYEHIQGILQHDAYHLGQVVIMAKRV